MSELARINGSEVNDRCVKECENTLEGAKVVKCNSWNNKITRFSFLLKKGKNGTLIGIKQNVIFGPCHREMHDLSVRAQTYNLKKQTHTYTHTETDNEEKWNEPMSL